MKPYADSDTIELLILCIECDGWSLWPGCLSELYSPNWGVGGGGGLFALCEYGECEPAIKPVNAINALVKGSRFEY